MLSNTRDVAVIPAGVTFAQAAVAQPAGIARHAVATRAAIQGRHQRFDQLPLVISEHGSTRHHRSVSDASQD